MQIQQAKQSREFVPEAGEKIAGGESNAKQSAFGGE